MTAKRFIDLPPVKARAAVDRLSTTERGALERELSCVLQSVAWKLGYIDSRYGAGCGDQGHDSAVNNANRMLRNSRKAIGYTYPDSSAIRV